MGKLIYKIFRSFFLKHYFNEQSKKQGFQDLHKKFVDSNGVQYYAYADDFDIPILRANEIQRRIELIRAGMGEKNLLMFCDAMDAELSKSKINLRNITKIITEIRERISLWVDMDLLFDTVAFTYIREDEDPARIDEEIHKQKIAQFRKDSMGGLYDFFYTAGLTEYIPYSSKSENDWNEYLREAEIKGKVIQKVMGEFITKAD